VLWHRFLKHEITSAVGEKRRATREFLWGSKVIVTVV